jgi:hypothetical protein
MQTLLTISHARGNLGTRKRICSLFSDNARMRQLVKSFQVDTACPGPGVG